MCYLAESWKYWQGQGGLGCNAVSLDEVDERTWEPSLLFFHLLCLHGVTGGDRNTEMYVCDRLGDKNYSKKQPTNTLKWLTRKEKSSQSTYIFLHTMTHLWATDGRVKGLGLPEVPERPAGNISGAKFDLPPPLHLLLPFWHDTHSSPADRESALQPLVCRRRAPLTLAQGTTRSVVLIEVPVWHWAQLAEALPVELTLHLHLNRCSEMCWVTLMSSSVCQRDII